MPNWCVHRMTVSGPAAERAKFLKGIDKDKEGHLLILQSHVPTPKELRNTTSPAPKPKTDAERTAQAALIEKYGACEWYNWQHNNWGIKWGDCDTEHTAFKRTDRYEFNCPWGVPTPALIKIAKLFPKLTFTVRYWERGMEFKGVVVLKGGEIVRDESAKYSGSKGG